VVIKPGGSVGEMGMFTGPIRSARITSYENSVGIVIKKRDLIEVLRAQTAMHIKLLSNLVTLAASLLFCGARPLSPPPLCYRPGSAPPSPSWKCSG